MASWTSIVDPLSYRAFFNKETRGRAGWRLSGEGDYGQVRAQYAVAVKEFCWSLMRACTQASLLGCLQVLATAGFLSAGLSFASDDGMAIVTSRTAAVTAVAMELKNIPIPQ
jgi:hypothetical protein